MRFSWLLLLPFFFASCSSSDDETQGSLTRSYTQQWNTAPPPVDSSAIHKQEYQAQFDLLTNLFFQTIEYKGQTSYCGNTYFNDYCLGREGLSVLVTDDNYHQLTMFCCVSPGAEAVNPSAFWVTIGKTELRNDNLVYDDGGDNCTAFRGSRTTMMLDSIAARYEEEMTVQVFAGGEKYISYSLSGNDRFAIKEAVELSHIIEGLQTK